MFLVCGCMIPTVRMITRPLLALLIATASASPAYALLCGEGSMVDCDNSYRDQELSCDTTYEATDINGATLNLPSIFPACPAKPMAMRSTEKLSFIDFSPYTYDYLRDPSDETLAYGDYLARGTPGDPSSTFRMIGKPARNVTQQKSCVDQIRVDGNLSGIEKAALIRLQLDNCANQFILNTAVWPFHKVGSDLTCKVEGNAARTCAQEDLCQPLELKQDNRQEYNADYYIKAAWTKLLNDPSYRVRGTSATTMNLSGLGINLPVNLTEPGLPANVQISNPIPVPNIGTIRLNAIAATPYEEIIDPSHPFSPRWDFLGNERDLLSPFTKTYGGDDKNGVFCAGNKDTIYKVDILSFRDKNLKFTEKVAKRIAYNAACDKETGLQRNPCCQVQVKGPYPVNWTCKLKSCKECYDMSADKPVCATDYQYTPDRARIKSKYIPVHPALRMMGSEGTELNFLMVAAMVYPRTAKCDPTEFGDANSDSMSLLCRNLRAPFTPVNKLKMRYNNPEDPPEKNVLTSGVQEGLSFTDYFKKTGNADAPNMPYPRLWDTGRSIQESESTDQDPMDVLGQYTAIVGVGREGNPAEDKKDERCMYGGWGAPAMKIGNATVTTPDPVTSWTELKLYQANTTREVNVVCLGRYEKAFKHRTPENQILVTGGAERTTRVKTVCAKNQHGRVDPTKCDTYELSDTEKAESITENENTWSSVKLIRESMPLSWRNYMGTPDDEQRPSFLKGDEEPELITGLDNAQCGDIILMPYGGAMGPIPQQRGLPKLARVMCPEGERADDAWGAIRKEGDRRYIQVQEADNGKWPDVCGTTNVLGEMKTRLLFRPGELRDASKNTLKRLNWTTSCIDTGLTDCEMEPWSTLKIYRPRNDVRNGQDAGGGS